MFQVTTALPKPEEAITKMQLYERVGQEHEVEEVKEDESKKGGKSKKQKKKDKKAADTAADAEQAPAEE